MTAIEPQNDRSNLVRPETLDLRWRGVEALAVAAIVVGIALCFVARPHAPLWIDETFTGALASQPTPSAFFHLLHFELASPLYYIVLWAWHGLFGISNAALRAPSLIFAIAAPLLVALVKTPGLDRSERLVWAAMLALWAPGIGFAQDARCYSLSVLLGVAQTLAFIRLLSRPGLAAAVVWVILCDLSIATHYDAALLALAQGLCLIVVLRRQSFPLLPSLLLTAPVIAMLAWQWPEMQPYLAPEATWYDRLTPDALTHLAAYAGPFWPPLPISLIWTAALVAIAVVLGRSGRPPQRSTHFETAAAIASGLGFAAVVAMGIWKPSFAFRYIAPFEPGLPLGLLLVLRQSAGAKVQPIFMALIALGIACDGVWLAAGARHRDSVAEGLNYQVASEHLMAVGVSRVVFAWDNPTGRIMRDDQLRAFGGFFFRRAGKPIEVIPLHLNPAHDPNLDLVEAARGRHAAILWVYDESVARTAAATFPPRIGALNRQVTCQDFEDGDFHIVACA